MDPAATRAYFLELQARIVAGLEAVSGEPFRRDEWTRPEGGGGISRADRRRRRARARRRPLLARHRSDDACVRDRASAGARGPFVGGDGRVARPASAQSLRADRASQRALFHRAKSRCGARVVVRRRHGPDALLRLCRGRRPLPPHVPRRARPIRRGCPRALQEVVRRLLSTSSTGRSRAALAACSTTT